MSNGLTSVFISTLELSGTHLAKADNEKRMIVWLLERDQGAIGCTDKMRIRTGIGLIIITTASSRSG